jgi:outer membrane cobalamin receptor
MLDILKRRCFIVSGPRRALALGALVGLLCSLTPRFAVAQAQKTSGEEALLLNEIPSVFGASRFDQAVTEAPASVSVITAEEVAAHGWRTLGEVLRTVRGFYVTNDRSYSYVGTRGFARSGDFNQRMLILIDGTRVNENVFDGAYVGFESMVDLSVVDRIEVIRGPSSSLYGANAFFAIINVVTSRGRAHGRMRVTGDVGSFGSRELGVSGGGRIGRGIEFVASAGRRRIGGQDLYFPEFDTPQTNRGMSVGRDDESRDRFFAKAEWGQVAIEAAINDRRKTIPTASFGTLFNAGRQTFQDRLANLALRLQQPYRDGAALSASLALNAYDFNGAAPYDGVSQRTWARGRWAVADAQYSRLIGGRHRVALGGAYTANARQEQGATDDRSPEPAFTNDTTANAAGLFSSAELHFGSRVIVNGGLRYDHSRWLRNTWSPRTAFIVKLDEGSALKLLFGQAFRAPTNYERFFQDGGLSVRDNIALVPERVSTAEILLEKVLSSQLKFTASTYRYRADRLIDAVIAPGDSLSQFQNSGRADGTGIETEVEIDLGKVSARGSYTLQRATDATGGQLSNSPQHLGVFTVSMPVAANLAQAGLEVRAMSARRSPTGDLVRGHAVGNLVLSRRQTGRGVEASLGVFNLLNAMYRDPVGKEHVQSAIVQDGRAVRATVGYRF